MKNAIGLLGITLCAAAVLPQAVMGADQLEKGFFQPPPSARPWVYWFPLDGNITSNGITLDLEAMRRTGIGGVLYMETEQGTPRGPAKFGGPLWRSLFQHACAEANRLGLEVNMNNDAGWCGSGGPWITPELSMQRLVWTEIQVEGPRRFEAVLQQPKGFQGFYRDIAVLAFPTPKPGARIENLRGKAFFQSPPVSLHARANWPESAPGTTVPRARVIEFTGRMDKNGRLTWEALEGKWTVLRIGHTSTGQNNHPAPVDGRGLECDKLSKEVAQVHFDGLMQKLIRDVGGLAGKTLVSTHIDSWEVGSQNWTPKFREEFQRLRGYDLLPFLPVVTGAVVDSIEVSERFLWDFRRTVSDLLLENYAGEFRKMARKNKLRLSMEGYHTVPVEELAYAGRSDEPMGEFWSWAKYGMAFSCTEMASAAHVYGKKIVGAEAFTATDAERWLGHPGNIKDLGDWAFCEGINRFVFHRYALQPWTDVRPGISMGPWGLHYERTQTWWEQSIAWHEYLARCQFLLQQGLFVADMLLLSPEGAPMSLYGQRAFSNGSAPLERPGHNFDVCPPEVVLQRLTVKDGMLVLPDGMSYRVLVLPRVETMTPELLRQVAQLVQKGATIVGAPPVKSPSLQNYPAADAEVKRLVTELWGNVESTELTGRTVGKGRVYSGGEFAGVRSAAISASSWLSAAKWIWRNEGNPASAAPAAKRFFRRLVTLPAEGTVKSAVLTMTADNSFECWVNGRRAGGGDNFGHAYAMNVASMLKSGTNVIAVAAVNATQNPNPAGLIGSLVVQFADSSEVVVNTDKSWEAADKAPVNWLSSVSADNGWAAALELGPLGMEPWGDVEQSASSADLFPSIAAVGRVLSSMGVQPDFIQETRQAPEALRYIHKRIGKTDVYFVANKNPQAEEALCSFRINRRRPELWWPDTGRMDRPAVYDYTKDHVRLPIYFPPHGSVFVIFRDRAKAESDRIVSVQHEGDTVASAREGRTTTQGGDFTNTFSVAVWALPMAGTELMAEANRGISGYTAKRNDALFPPPGHEVYAEPGHAGVGLAIGTNGISVFEHSADHFAPVLVHRELITKATHVAVVYSDGTPSLYLNGRFARKGVKSGLVTHPGVGVPHAREVRAFEGTLGSFNVVGHALGEAGVGQWVQTMPRPASRRWGESIELTRAANGQISAVAWEPGRYVLRTAEGQTRSLRVEAVPAPLEISGPWEVSFSEGQGAPARVQLPELVSWHTHADVGVKYFSGEATYRKTFEAPAEFVSDRRRVFLDLGKVAVSAEVKLNGKPLGVLWKAPFRVEVTGLLAAGQNTLEAAVVNLWINRMIGDERLPEDSNRNPNGTLKSWPDWLLEGKPNPAERVTFTSWRLWKKDAPLQESGLLGPVRLQAATVVSPE